MAKFCLGCLKSDKAIASLTNTVRQYESVFHEQQERSGLSTLVLPKDQSLLLYALQALPYHLSQCSPSYLTEAFSSFLNQPTASKLWAKAYWAMSNPPRGHRSVLNQQFRPVLALNFSATKPLLTP